MPYIILENIRSAYNVGNMIRTADALGFDVIISGYSPSPFIDEKVKKTSLGAEDKVKIVEFWDPLEALKFVRSNNFKIIAAEITDSSISLIDFVDSIRSKGGKFQDLAVIFGNEVEGVLPQTLDFVDHVVHIPMNGIKESLNVGQSSAIFMREIYKHI